MDVNDLNKSQLILLAILLSFITSIATGITTVTLMQQAPTSVTTPINRVIQQTVEKIQQVEGKTTVQTVVVKEEDLVVDAIAKNQSAVFVLSKDGFDVNGKKIEVPAGRAFVVSNSGVLVADAKIAPFKENYYLKNSSGKFKGEFISTNSAGFTFLKIGAALNGTDKATFTVPAFGDLEKMKVGQKLIILGSTLSSFIFEGGNEISTSVPKTAGGGLVMNLDGEVLGIALSGDAVSFVSIGTVTEALKVVDKQ